MKKSLLTIIIILTSILSYGQSAIYMMWKMEAEKNIRLVPKYGNVEKTQVQKDADQAFIKTTLVMCFPDLASLSHFALILKGC